MIIECDGWTDIPGRSVLGIISINNEDLDYHVEKIKDMSDQHHRTTNMALVVDEVIKKYESEKINALVTDNAASMVKVRHDIKKDYPSLIIYHCGSHLLNLFTCDMLKHSFATRVLKA